MQASTSRQASACSTSMRAPVMLHSRPSQRMQGSHVGVLLSQSTAAKQSQPHSLTQQLMTTLRPASRQVCARARGAGSDPWWERDTAPNMRDISGVQELVDALADAGDRLVIVEFFATWCNACRALFPKICKLMCENPEVVFLKVNFEDSRDMCRTMNVKVLPFFHFYRGAEGRVEQFSCTVSKIQRFRDALETHGSSFCSLESLPGLPEFPEIVAHPELHPELVPVPCPSENTPTIIGDDGVPIRNPVPVGPGLAAAAGLDLPLMPLLTGEPIVAGFGLPAATQNAPDWVPAAVVA